MISQEDREKIETFVEAKNKAHRVNGNEITDLYNRVMNKKVRPTGCGSCIKQRISEMERKLKQELEAEAKQQENDTKITEQNDTQEVEPKKKGRPKKKKEE